MLVWVFGRFQCSSASRKFLNHRSPPSTHNPAPVSVLFSEPKIPQLNTFGMLLLRFTTGFSALQRAENSSIGIPNSSDVARLEFQCSSASRKFLNRLNEPNDTETPSFQCSSASRKFLNCRGRSPPGAVRWVSVLFSEPKIPQSMFLAGINDLSSGVSVLFSEPKIPQYAGYNDRVLRSRVSVLFSEPKIPQCGMIVVHRIHWSVSVLFSEPKIPQ